MEKPDSYGDWVLLPTGEEQPQSIAPDQELLSAARAAWPHALAQAEREFTAARLGSDGAAFAVQVWEQLLRSVSKARQRNRDRRPPISNLEGYLITAFRHRFTRVLVREQKRAAMIELVSSSFDLEANGTAELQNGTTRLRVVADLQSLSPGAYVLQMRTDGLGWNSYPLDVH